MRARKRIRTILWARLAVERGRGGGGGGLVGGSCLGSGSVPVLWGGTGARYGLT